MNNDLNDITGGDTYGSDKKRLLDDLYSDTSPEASGTPDDAAFEKDSAEGLAQLHQDRVPVIVEQLNRHLLRQLKKKKKKTGRLPDQSFVYITVITVLVLVIIAYIVVRYAHAV